MNTRMGTILGLTLFLAGCVNGDLKETTGPTEDVDQMPGEEAALPDTDEEPTDTDQEEDGDEEAGVDTGGAGADTGLEEDLPLRIIIQVVTPEGVIDTVLKPSGFWGVPEGMAGSESNPIVYPEHDTIALFLGDTTVDQPPGTYSQYFQTVPLGPNLAQRGFGAGELNFHHFGANGASPQFIVSYSEAEPPLYFPVGWPMRGLFISCLHCIPTSAEETLLLSWNHAYTELWFIRTE